MDKSYVSLEAHVCPICGKEHETNSILFDRRLRNSMERKTVTGYSLCPEHEQMRLGGYLALVAVDEAQSTREYNGNLLPQNAYRTGDLIHIKYAAAERVFNVPLDEYAFVYCDPEVINKLKEMAGNSK